MLKVEQVSLSYRETGVQRKHRNASCQNSGLVLDNVSFCLKPHTFTAVLGKNGCGKSTLVSCINQQLHYTGKISYADTNLALMPPRERAKAIAILPQMLERPHVTVEQLVCFGRNPYLDFGKRLTDEDRAAVQQAMADVGVTALSEKMVDSLSGGERQRAYLAMTLAQQTRVIVLDEPTTYMDMEYEASFLEKLTELKTKHKKTLLVIMHNLSQALHYADRILVLDKQRIVFDGTRQECLDSPVLEQIFHVKKHIFEENGEQFVLFTAE